MDIIRPQWCLRVYVCITNRIQAAHIIQISIAPTVHVVVILVAHTIERK